MAEKSIITAQQREDIVKYFTKGGGCMSKKISDEQYDLLVATRLQDASNQQQALAVLGIDESQVQEIPPVCFHGYVFDDARLSEMSIPILSICGNDDEWRSSAYMVTWIFFGNDEIYFYQEVFCMDTNSGWTMTDEFFYTDVVNFYTVTQKMQGQKKDPSFAIQVPGETKFVRLSMNERNMAAIEGMKQKLREKKLQ